MERPHPPHHLLRIRDFCIATLAHSLVITISPIPVMAPMDKPASTPVTIPKIPTWMIDQSSLGIVAAKKMMSRATAQPTAFAGITANTNKRS